MKATKIKKNQRIKNNYLHCFQWINLPYQSCLYLFSYKTMLLHSVILYSSLCHFSTSYLCQPFSDLLSFYFFFPKPACLYCLICNSFMLSSEIPIVIFLTIFNLLRFSWFSACLPVLIQILPVVINPFLHSLIQHLNTLI